MFAPAFIVVAHFAFSIPIFIMTSPCRCSIFRSSCRSGRRPLFISLFILFQWFFISSFRSSYRQSFFSFRVKNPSIFPSRCRASLCSTSCQSDQIHFRTSSPRPRFQSSSHFYLFVPIFPLFFALFSPVSAPLFVRRSSPVVDSVCASIGHSFVPLVVLAFVALLVWYLLHEHSWCKADERRRRYRDRLILNAFVAVISALFCSLHSSTLVDPRLTQTSTQMSSWSPSILTRTRQSGWGSTAFSIPPRNGLATIKSPSSQS
jgi:hypothetical protein